GAERLSEIYRAAARIICEKGYHAASISNIADAVGITKAAIYHYIPEKRELLFAIISFGMDQLDQVVITPARAITDAEQRLRTIIANHARLITSSATPQGNQITIVTDETAWLPPAQRRKINQRKRAYIDLVQETLKQLKEEGKLREVDITTAAFSL